MTTFDDRPSVGVSEPQTPCRPRRHLAKKGIHFLEVGSALMIRVVRRTPAKKRDRLLARAPWLEQLDVEIVVADIVGGRFDVDPNRSYWFEDVLVRGVDFSGSRFGWYRDGEFGGSFTANRSTFVDCDFSRVRFDRGVFRQWDETAYIDCRFDGAEIWSRQGRSSMSLGDARFERCTFDGAKLRMWIAQNRAQFVGCSFATRVDRCDFYGRPVLHARSRKRNDFRDNNFSRADLVHSRFWHGIDIDAQRWPPDGYIRLNSARVRLERALNAVAGLDPSLQHDVEIRLRMLRDDAKIRSHCSSGATSPRD